MNVIRSLSNAISYLSEGALRWFSPSQDQYPNTGTQPFTGETSNKRKRRHRDRFN